MDDLDSEAVSQSVEPASQETPIPEDIAREEARHLYGLMEELSKSLRASKKYDSESLNINPKMFPNHNFAKICDFDAPFRGTGDGILEFTDYGEVNYIDGKWAGINTPYQLDIALHMDTATKAQAEELFTKGNGGFNTRFFFDKDGEYKVISMFPPEIEEERETIIRTKDYKFVETPFTPEKAEIAGAALNYLLKRVRDVNTPPVELGSPSPPKPTTE